MHIEPIGGGFAGRVTGLDLARSLSKPEFAALLKALGDHGVLCFPAQLLAPAALRDFSSRFGSLQVLSANGPGEPGYPEVSILSNMVQDGRPVGIPDAGQDWHTDMSYNPVVGFVNVLVAYKVPTRDGRPLGATEFANTQRAYEDLPAELRERLAGAEAVHDFAKYHDDRVRRGSMRAPLSEEQRREKPPRTHPVFLTHPITGRKVIYVNPGFTTRILGLEPEESAKTLDFLFRHVLQEKFRYVHRWSVGDVLLWDHIGTWHYAVPDYRPDEHRLIKRCQVMADRVFDPEFVRAALQAA